MTPEEKPEFVTSVTALFETFGRELSEAQLLGYWIGLEDLPLDAVQIAIRRAIRECERFAPTPAELRKLAGETSAEDAALLAWSDLLQAARVGPYAHVDFADPMINATVRAMCGDWSSMCLRFEEGKSQEKWLMKEFIRFYTVMARRKCSEDETKPLSGLSSGQVCHRTGKLMRPKPIKLGKPRETPTIACQPHGGALPIPSSLASPDDV